MGFCGLGRGSRLSFVVAFTLSGAVFGAIPDRINVPKFKKTWETKTQLALEARGEAKDKLAILFEKRRDRKHLQGQQAQKVWRIQQNKASISGLRKNNESLNQTISNAKAQIQSNITTRQDLLTEINRLTTGIGQTETQRDNQAQVVKRFQLKVNTEQANYDEASEDLSETRTELSDSIDDLDQARNEVDTLSDKIASLQRKLREIATEKAAYEQEMQTGATKKQALAADLQIALNRLDQVRKRLDGANKRLESLQTEIDTAVQDFNNADGRLTHVTNRLQKLRQEKRQLGKTITAYGVEISTLTQEIGLLDIEKQRLEEAIPLMEKADTQFAADHKAASARVRKLTKDLAAEKDEAEKKKIQKQLTRAENRLAEIDKDLKANRQELRKSRKDLLKIPTQKTTKRVALLEAQSNQTASETQLVKVEGQIENSVERKEKLEQAKTNATQDKNRAMARRKTLLTERNALIAQAKNADDEVKSLEQAQRQLLERQKLVVRLLTKVNQDYRVLDLQTIPAAKQDHSNAQNVVAGLDGAVRQLTQDVRDLERDLQNASTNLNTAKRNLGREQGTLSTLQSKLSVMVSQKQTAVSRRAELVTENQGLNQKISSSQQRILDQNQSIDGLIASNVALQKQADDLERNIFKAETAEAVAKGVYELADTRAGRLEEDRDVAKGVYDQTVANYASEKASAIAAASFAAIAHGSKEGSERGARAGAPQGRQDGARDGQADGAAEGKQRDYDAAYASAFDTKLVATKNSKALETAAQKAQREASSALQSAFAKGKRRGEIQGRKDGFANGDNATQEKAGFDAGYQLGKRKALDEAERTHRPMGRAEREQEILAAPPKNTEERDAEEDSVGPEEEEEEGEQLSSWNLEKIWNWLIPTANADGKLGDISESQVPSVKWTYRQLVTGHDHPDFDEAYKTTYDATYESNYTKQYMASYKAAYVGTYTAAYDKAEATALAVEYTQSKAEGTRDGSAAGLFQGLGYNGGYAALYPVGKQAGEETAYARGKEAGTPKGYSENIQKARADALAAGRQDTESRYQNGVHLKLVAGTVSLRDEDGDGKFSVGETVRLDAKLRNFGGVDAADGATEIKVVSSQGLKVAASPVALGELAAETEFDYSNLLVAEVQPSGRIALQADVLWQGSKVGSLQVSEEVYAPYQVSYTYYYDSKADLRVGGVNNGTGYHNAFWIKALPGASVSNMEVSMQPVDTSVATFSWEGGTSMNGWKRLGSASSQGWVKTGFFLRANKYQGLKSNQFRVRLRDRAGRILMDKTVDAPIEVKR